MKSFSTSAFKIILLLIIFLSISNNHLAAVELLFPNGGEMLMAGGVYTIVWKYNREYEEEIPNIHIDLSIDNGQTWENIVLTWSTNWYQWQVPYVDSNQCLVRISLELLCPLVIGPCPEADVDWDWDVDFFDFALLASAWQSSPVDDKWNPHCDITEDGIIDYHDLDILTKWWLIGINEDMDISAETFTIFQL
jgi:hypothetical protein